MVILMAACSPQKRMAYLVKHHPEVINNYLDTVTLNYHDTTIREIAHIIPGYTDSFYIPHDTIIYRDGLIISRKGDKFGVNIPQDTIRFTDTFIKEIPVPAIKGKIQDCSGDRMLWLALGLSWIFIFLIFRFRK